MLKRNMIKNVFLAFFIVKNELERVFKNKKCALVPLLKEWVLLNGVVLNCTDGWRQFLNGCLTNCFACRRSSHYFIEWVS